VGDTGEKTEEATPEKLRKAKEEGQVPKSIDFVSSLNFGLGFMTMVGMLAWISTELTDFARAALEGAARDFSLAAIFKTLGEIPFLILKLSIPIGVSVFTMGLMANFLQTGFFMAFKVLIPKLDKVNPVNGLKGLFKLKKFIDLIKNMLKLGLAAWLAWSVMSDSLHNMVLTVRLPLTESAKFGGTVLWDYMTKTIFLFIGIGVADLLWSRKQFNKEMMMSKYDVKQEYKQSEGDPHMKGQRKQLAHELLFSGGPAAVKNADAVVVNPTHIGVAIKYDSENDGAPKVVAKGQGVHAEKIKELAKQYGIPILRNIPLAQALNKLDVGEEVPEELYEAVAEVLSFVFKIKEEEESRKKAQRGEQPAATGTPERARDARMGRHAQVPAGGGAAKGTGATPGGRDNLLKRGR
jgi:flagellar biosynthesis protein FlhB